MKRILLLLSFWGCRHLAYAQTGPAEQVAAKIANRMRDTLQLDSSQRQAAYNVNLQLHGRKALARQQAGSYDSLARRLQRIENDRDTLYYPFLTPAQYDRYKQKKAVLVSNN